MHHNDFIYFLQDKQNRFWGLDSSGEVVLNNNPYTLDFSPDGWDDTTIKNIRNKKYWAVDRTVSTSFKYVEDAAQILKHIFYKLGTEESVYLVICEQKLAYTPNVSYGYWYKQIFKSEIDFSTFEHNGPYISVTTAEEGLAKHLKSNENTIYEIPFGTEKVKTDGVVQKGNGNFFSPEISGITDLSHYISLSSLPNQENIAGSGVAFLSANNQDVGQTFPFNLSAETNYFFTTTQTKTFRIVGSIKISVAASTSYQFIFQDSFNTIHYQSNPSFTALPSGEHTISFDFNATLPAGGKMFCIAQMLGGSIVDYKDSTFDVRFDYRYNTTYTSFLRPQFIFSELINKMTGGEFTAEDCPYFGTTQNWNKVFTSGNAIRQLPDAVLKISLSQFFGFFDTFDAVGIREKNKKVLFDRKAALVDSATIIDLGEVNNPVIKFDKTIPFNELAIGYHEEKNEQGMINGKNEVNTVFNFSLGTSKTPRKYDKTTPVKVSCYAIENLRIEKLLKDTTDDKNDNEVFALHITDTLITGSGDIPDHYELDRTYNAFVTGVEQADSIFNLIFSPKNCFIRSGDYLHSCFYKSDNKIFKFLTADRNKDMAYLNGSDVRVESADVTISDLAAPFFTPVTITDEAEPPEDLNDSLDENPLLIFQFTIDGNIYKGISMENSVNPKRNKKQTFTVLSVPENDLLKLEKYFG